MTESPRRTPPDRSSPAGEPRSRPSPGREGPRPLNSAGRPVDPSGRVRGRGSPDASGGGDASQERGFDWARLRRSAGSPRQGAAARARAGEPWSDEFDPRSEASRRRASEGLGSDAPREARREGPPPAFGRAPDLSPLVALLDGIRALIPRELERQFTALLREVLMTLRSVIDWYLERLDGGRAERRVEDIPID